MKKVIIAIVLIGLSVATFSQQPKVRQNFSWSGYQQKSKHQKTTAWILLIGGSAFTAICIAIGANSAIDELATAISTGHDNKSFVAGEVFFYTGSTAMFSSIPLFIASGCNKRKAISFSTFFKMGRSHVLQNKSFNYQSCPALSIRINGSRH